ncbi:snRNA-activating protein complex subunit 1-like [Ischnura elegans]|uniref:snRNA-activating protein complex subunit 1-like n=1 Tax=Ischnura elegans TaxID=197161 RepID=UPI001ED89766|nr:snRNA-activating protein complex subunit 1-like [Ischnura elegans]
MSGGSSYIAAGVRTDCENLMTAFMTKNSLRFDDFCAVWQDMRFPSIYCGRKTFSELVEFTEEVLQIAKTFMLPPHPFQVRAGGIYLTAGLYYKQPTSGLVKIRLTCEDLENLNPFLKQLRGESHWDVLFMFSKMLAENAFVFTLSPRTYGIEYNIRKYLLHKPGDDNISSMKDEESSDEEEFCPQTFASDFLKKTKMIDRMQDIEQKYQTMKTLLYGDQKGELPKSLSYAAPSLLEAMNAAIGSKSNPYSAPQDAKPGRFKKAKVQERASSHQETEADSEEDSPQASSKPPKKSKIGLPPGEWSATAHPKNRGTTSNSSNQNIGSTSEENVDNPGSSSVTYIKPLSFSEL